jgi:hypothetical protein
MLRLRLHSANAALGQTLVELCQHRIERVELAGLGGLGGHGRGRGDLESMPTSITQLRALAPSKSAAYGGLRLAARWLAAAHGLATDCAAGGRLNVQIAERAWTGPIWHLA